ncbi:hypothetical protein Calhy_0785 [Caldicellulosiruptor hydrothermalis 108]|uniref:C1q domain-containing protein n=1 Tax=Caldicellulosiruptor hydrothermalis (strain DSM 18901 / VKM B-2411 / 108) TaxID=632292 RepID=E4QE28_CALH1|nr:hypothetical protein [Caldicellulosiruptor hydrothermalis]ADQ06522.1 hypothetical protein Calhy_0785 [Caldicellulosiruptor hydrothermalis 108]
MPELTPRLGIKKPLGNETVTRASFNENWDIIDQNAAKQADLDAHITAPAPHSGHAPLQHTHAGSDITSAVASATNADTVDGKHASDFAAASHTHVIADITNLPSISSSPIANTIALRDSAGKISQFIPMFIFWNNTTISIPNATETKLSFNTVIIDTDNIYNAADTTKFVIKTAGKYIFMATVEFAMNSTGFRQIAIKKNGINIVVHRHPATTSELTIISCCSPVISCSVNDYIEVYVYQNSGGALSINVPPYAPIFSGLRVGD